MNHVQLSNGTKVYDDIRAVKSNSVPLRNSKFLVDVSPLDCESTTPGLIASIGTISDIIEPIGTDDYFQLTSLPGRNKKAEIIACVGKGFRSVSGGAAGLTSDIVNSHRFDKTEDRISAEMAIERMTL